MIQVRKCERRGRALFVVVVSLLAISAPVSAAPPDTDPGPPPEQFFVVGFHELPPGLAEGDDLHGATVQRVDATLRFARVVTRSPQQFQERARADRRTRYVEPDPVLPLALNTPNDPRFSDQYGPQRTGAPQAWDKTMGDQDARVCVIDTGVRYSHEDITGTRWLGGTDYVNKDSDPMDDDGHGTHVTGIAAGSLNNAKGVAGMGNVGIYGVKVLDDKGAGTWSAVASGLSWCADRGGRIVINMSLGASGGATVLADGVKYAADKGALMVAAAGNSGSCSNCVDYPAKYPEVIAVTCTTSSDSQCSFSSDGPESELAAPGNSILSLGNSSDTAYTSISGTSMSTPHVAGAAALVWSQDTQLTADQLRQRLRGSARDLGAVGWDEVYGYGVLDAGAAMGVTAPPTSGHVDENFDDGIANGWTLSGLWHVASKCSAASSPSNYLGYNKDSDCTYATGTRTTGLATFDADLTGATAATLAFDHRFRTESYPYYPYDQMRVQVSTNGGGTWTTLKQWDSRNANQLLWTTESLDLGPYAGQAVKLRFFFDSVTGSNNSFEGWFVDNVKVIADSTPAGPQPPVANAGPDQTVRDADGTGAEAVVLNGSGSSDPDGDITSYEWKEGDTVLASTATATVNLAVGSHTITLKVTDSTGAFSTDTVVVTVAANQPPTARFTSTASGLVLDVDGSTSSDPDGTIASYAWEWGDNTPAGSGRTAQHSYAAAGPYTVRLTVTDNGGATGSTTQSVTVSTATTSGGLMDENFDDGVADGWTVSGLWHLSSKCSTAPSPPNHLAYNKDTDCTYATGTRTIGSATFGADLTGRTAATLSFDHRFETEYYPYYPLDQMKVQVSTNGGSTWTTLQQWDSRNTKQPWTTQTLNLSPYAGGPVTVRFFFDSLVSSNNNYPGWFLDNVKVASP